MSDDGLRLYSVSISNVLVAVQVEAADEDEAREAARESIRQSLEADLADDNLTVEEVTP